MSRQCIGALAALALVGCGSGGGRVEGTSSVPNDSPAASHVALLRAPKRPGEIILHGEASPAMHGPFVLHGRYLARFQQYAPEDPHLDFGGETPFVAAMVRGRDTHKKLFRAAAATGRATITANGAWQIDVSFGDYPYVIRLTPAP